jgi:hypothetical protein
VAATSSSSSGPQRAQEAAAPATGALSFTELVRLGLKTASAREGDPEASKEYDAAVSAFKSAHGGPEVRVAIFRESGLGAYLDDDRLRWCWLARVVRYDWSDGLRLLYRIDAVAEQARDWWDEDDQDRQSILDRSYGIETAILAAVHREHMHRQTQKVGEDEDVSRRYANNLEALVPEIARVEGILDDAAQRKTQAHYGRGMLWGAVAIAVLCALIGAVFYGFDTPAWYGVALPCGAAGAIVSVLQRMTSGRLQLDVHAAPKMTQAYGALRPAIGGILGMALFVLFEGGLLPAIEVAEDSRLPFYAAVGFLAGFNERFAQDMLAGSARPLTRVHSFGETGPESDKDGTQRVAAR